VAGWRAGSYAIHPTQGAQPAPRFHGVRIRGRDAFGGLPNAIRLSGNGAFSRRCRSQFQNSLNTPFKRLEVLFNAAAPRLVRFECRSHRLPGVRV